MASFVGQLALEMPRVHTPGLKSSLSHHTLLACIWCDGYLSGNFTPPRITWKVRLNDRLSVLVWPAVECLWVTALI